MVIAALVAVGCHGGNAVAPGGGGATDDAGEIPSGDDDAGSTPPTGFRHPGILVDRAQLDFVKAKIAAGAEPWTSAFKLAKASRWASLTYQATPRAIVECGSYSNPNLGCSDEQSDAVAAYTQALLFYFTGNETYAKNSAGEHRALRYHAAQRVPTEGRPWRRQRERQLGADDDGGDAGHRRVSRRRGDVPARSRHVAQARPPYVYLSSDGALPLPPPGGNKTTPAALATRIQKVDLYAEESKRMTAGFEFNAQFLDGVAAPSGLCAAALTLTPNPTWEIGYNAYANRAGIALPHTRAVILAARPAGATHHIVFETLTHAELAAVGLP